MLGFEFYNFILFNISYLTISLYVKDSWFRVNFLINMITTCLFKFEWGVIMFEMPKCFIFRVV
jgi:hypothetical protein